MISLLAKMRPPMPLILFLGLLALVSYTVWVTTEFPLSLYGPQLMENPWGLLTLADLYTGLLIFCLLVFKLERNKLVFVIWSVAILTLGHAVSLLYLLFHWRRLQNLFRLPPSMNRS